MMTDLESNAKEYVNMVWNTLFDQSLAAADQGLNPQEEESRLGIVSISGKWNGFVNIYLPSPLAVLAAEKMFFLEPGASSQSEVQDAVGEIINMIGGNIKAILPEPNQLSTPDVIWNAATYAWPERLDLLADLSFKSTCGQTLKVQIRQKA